MKKICEILHQAAVQGDVGIEIEVEGENLPTAVGGNWLVIGDGSLRPKGDLTRAAEYVLAKPISPGDVAGTLKTLGNAFEVSKSTLNFSFRTSVHVHINAQQLTEAQLLNMVYTYLLIEEPLLNFCGKERKGNRFCLRMQDAEGLLDTVMKLVNGGVSSLVLAYEDQIRYSALNLASVKKYGSVEFRSMRGTADQAILKTWISALLNLRSFAQKANSVQGIYKMFTEMSAEDFIKEVLGDAAKPFIYKKMDKDMQRSFSLAIDIPFAAKAATKKVAKVPEFVVDDALVRVIADIEALRANPDPIARVRRPVIIDDL